MNTFLKDKEEYGKAKFSEGEQSERQSSIKKMIASYRKNFSLDNAAIFPLLKESYGSNFTDEQLMDMLNNKRM